jgi:hypothetical protein
MGGLTGNTRNSHRLLAWAAAEHGLDKQNQLAEALFNGFFCKVCGVAYFCKVVVCVVSYFLLSPTCCTGVGSHCKQQA